MFMNPIFPENSDGVTLLFEHSASRACEIDYFEIFSRLRENQLARRFVVKFNLLLLFLISYCWECFMTKKVFLKFHKIYSNKSVTVASNFIEKQTPLQEFEFCETFKDTFFNRTPHVQCLLLVFSFK